MKLSRFDASVMAVLLVLLLLIILGLLTVRASPPDRSIRRSQMLVVMLDAACRQYRERWGAFPPAAPDSGSATLLRCLGAAERGGPCVLLPAEHVRDGLIVDEWGNPLRYENPGRRNPGGVDLWSTGPELRRDDDDLTNWWRAP